MKSPARKLSKVMASLAVCLFLAIPVAAQDAGGTIEVLFGKYSVKEARFKTIYPGANSIYGLALSAFVHPNVNLCLDILPFYREGELSYTKEKTTFAMIPVSLTARYVRTFGFVSPYIGVGGDMVFYFEDSPIGSIFHYANGYHFQGGAYLRFGRRVPVWLNLQAKYMGVKAKSGTTTIDLGGWQMAVGLAFVFK